MKRISVLLFLTCSIAAVRAQTVAEKVVVWSGERGCGYVSAALLEASGPVCSTALTPRGPVSAIAYGDVVIAAAFLEKDGFLLLAAQIENRSAAPLDLDTDRWGAIHFASPDDFVKGRKPILAETSIPSRDLARSIKSGAGMDNSSDTFLASIAKASEVREVRRSDGTRVKKLVIVDDAEAQEMASSRSVSRSEHAAAEQERLRRHAITQKWIGPGEKIQGLVYFRRVKKARLVVFSLPVEGTSFVFRLPRKK